VVEVKVTENIWYPTYNIKRRDHTLLENDDTNGTHSIIMEKKLNLYGEEDFIENKNKKRKGFFFP